MWKSFNAGIENEPIWNREIFIKIEEEDSTIEKVFYGSEKNKNINNLTNMIGCETHRKQLKEYYNTKKRLFWCYEL